MGGDEEVEEELVARGRLAIIASSLPTQDWESAQWLPSNSNDVWRLHDVVLRVCWRGDRRRLLRELQISQELPSSLLHPAVLGAADHEGLTWQLTRYIPGAVLADTWLEMERSRLREIVAQLAQMLKTLHGWTPSPEVRDVLAAREGAQLETVGVNLLPLPIDRAMDLLGPASRLPYVDPALIRAVERRIEALADVDPFARDEVRAVVHGDAQPSNLIIEDHRIVALLDYEWCRMAPIDVELAIWMHILRVSQILSPGRVLPPVMRWLREDYPQLFAHPDLEGRLWLSALTFGLQGLLIWPPDAPERDLVATHHVHALRALVDAPPSALLD